MRKLLHLSEEASKYLIAAVLIIVPLLSKFPLLKVPGTYVSVRFEDILMLILGLALIPKIVLDFKKVWKDQFFRLIVIFFSAALLSLLSGAFLTQSLELRLGFLHWTRRIEYITPFLAAYLLIPRDRIEEYLKFYFKILVIVIAVAFLYGIGQRYFNFPVIITQNEEYSKGIALRWTPGAHINSTFAGHYDLSAFMVLTMPILLGVLFSVRSKASKIAIAIASGMGLWLLISSISRTAQATYLFAVTITLFLLRKFKSWIVVLIISLICMFMSSGLDARFSQAIKVLYEHITTGKSFGYVPGFSVKAENFAGGTAVLPSPAPEAAKSIKDVSISIRYNVEWPRAIRAFLKNPILGTGYSSIDLATDNDYLRMLGETGILGLTAFGLIFAGIGKKFLVFFKNRTRFTDYENGFLAGLFGGVMGTFATALLIDLFEASKFAIIFWLLLGCAVNLLIKKEYEQ